MPSKYASSGLESCSPPSNRYGIEANPAASSQVRDTTRNPSRKPTGPAACAVKRSSARPKPLVIAPAATNGSTGSPYPSANGIGNRAARPRNFPSVPTSLATAARSIANRRGRPIRATASVTSQGPDDPGRVRRLGEDDDAVARLEDVVAVREDRVPVPDDGSDDRVADGHVAERHADVLARVARRHVEHLVAVALEHGDLLRARVVGEAHDLLRRDAARVDRHVDSRAVEGADRDGLVRDRDRERDAVDP